MSGCRRTWSRKKKVSDGDGGVLKNHDVCWNVLCGGGGRVCLEYGGDVGDDGAGDGRCSCGWVLWRQELRMPPLWLGCLLEPGLEEVVELEKCARWQKDLLVWGGLRWDVRFGLRALWTLAIVGQRCPQRWWRPEVP